MIVARFKVKDVEVKYEADKIYHDSSTLIESRFRRQTVRVYV